MNDLILKLVESGVAGLMVIIVGLILLPQVAIVGMFLRSWSQLRDSQEERQRQFMEALRSLQQSFGSYMDSTSRSCHEAHQSALGQSRETAVTMFHKLEELHRDSLKQQSETASVLAVTNVHLKSCEETTRQLDLTLRGRSTQ